MSAIDLTDPAGYRFWVEERIRFSDLDVLGHVNNNAFGVLFEQGRVGLVEACEAFHPDLPWTTVLARSVVDYRAEIRYPATVRIGVRLLRLGNTSYTLGAAIFTGDTCSATQEAVCVIVDQKTHRPMPIPERLRVSLAAY
ncbi:thioesterase family protein [Azospirillum sp.]|uniref:acyl-CoA thioesterase n=1 Tax=Azospirillum sp. TaxID=34012 RepID=UPI002D27567A|nr:thioesterase family protein [Azospirillum sp.]HYD67492.1 thioesterase family protein [Azospirillum sp.]